MVDDRRRSGRFEPLMQIPARVGRREGVVLNVSHRGARVRHPGSLKPNELVDLAFPYADGQFASRARVLSCRVVPLKDPNGAIVFESRFAFVNPSPEAMALLEKLLGR
jgi:PilZ domain